MSGGNGGVEPTEILAARPTYVDPTYREALALTVEARNYLDNRRSTKPGNATTEDRLAESCETMRLTARLTQSMAWLMTQRAVHAGELTRNEASRPEWRLSGHDVCGHVVESNLTRLPLGLRSLLDRSFHLYRRIERLDGATHA